MNYRRTSLLALVALVMGSAVAYAHNGIEHVLGTVTAVTDSSITVETVKHTSVTVIVDAATTYTHSDEKATLKDVKKGQRVAINAKESTEKKLVAVSVKWGASATAAPAHAEHKD
ncbi:MAG: DUF5666 domain-containing protein [Bryobacteraceae bacterium]